VGGGETVTVFLFAPPGQDQEWQPPVDVYRMKWGWILKLELAGVRMEDLSVHVSKRAVTVSGIRRDYMIESGCSHYSMEITYSRFRRSIELPEDLTGSKLRLDYRDGILFIRIRNREEEEEGDCK
jgi:HSP20 family protein